MSRKIRNWPEYNRSLIKRGSINFWISTDVIETWVSQKSRLGAGRPEKYSDQSIEAACMIRFYFHLSLRATEGFISSIFGLMNVSLPVPSYSRISRRMKQLKLDCTRLSNTRPTDIVIDATGVKLYGDGEWHRKIHGVSKRKKWKKMTLGVCPKSHEIIFNLTSDDSIGDVTLFKETFNYLPRTVKTVIMDGAGDTHTMYDLAEEQSVKLIAPPRKGSVYRIGADRTRRDQYIREIRRLGNNEDAFRTWKKKHGYHRRSLAETAISRFKGILGCKLKSHGLLNQHNEMVLKSLILNKINELGMPQRV